MTAGANRSTQGGATPPASEGEPEAGHAEDASSAPSSPKPVTFTVTRKFGADPVKKHTTVTPAIFARFEWLVNRMIRAGVSLPDKLFEGKGLEAVKKFYRRVRQTPALRSLWAQRKGSSLKLHNRTWRCAAQHAYFALRDHKLRVRLLRHFIEAVTSLRDETLLFNSKFPQRRVVKAVQRELAQADLPLTKGQRSYIYLENHLRWLRNLVKRRVREKCKQGVADTFATLSLPPHLESELVRWVHMDMLKFLKSYLFRLSGKMTHLIKQVLKSKNRCFPPGQKTIVSLITGILEANSLSIMTVRLGQWKQVRKAWRNALIDELQQGFGGIPMGALVARAVAEVQSGLTPERVRTLLFDRRPPWVALGAGDLSGFNAFLVNRALAETESRLLILLTQQLRPLLQRVLRTFQTAPPRDWATLPHFQSQSIPFGLDDGYIYTDQELKDLCVLAQLRRGVPIGEIAELLLRNVRLKHDEEPYKRKLEETKKDIEKLIQFDAKHNWFEAVKKRRRPIQFELQVELGNRMQFELKTPRRFLSMLQAGFIPMQPTLLKKGGGGLILAIPFEKHVPKDQCLKPSDLPQMPHPLIMAGLDLGLKTLAVLSIGEKDALTAGAWGTPGQEIARYFLDPKDLFTEGGEWFKQPECRAGKPPSNLGKRSNLKRRLTNLQAEARRHQAERDKYRKYLRKKGINPRHVQKFADLSRTVKRIWRRVTNLHEELARQLATRIVAVCAFHGVQLLRLEDLRWARHSKKYKVGYFLATWQVHWFFGQIQARIAELAPRQGILVEWVRARYTSSRCSKCKHVGKTRVERRKARQGKGFKCPECGFQLDADLNAARNIRIAPRSPSIPPLLYAVGGGSPYLPPEDASVSA